MKKNFIALAAAVLTLSLCGCGESENKNQNSSETVSKAAIVSAASQEAVSAASEETVSTASEETPAAAGSLQQALEKVKAEVQMPAETNDYSVKRIKRSFGIEEAQMEEFAGYYCVDGVDQEQVIYIRAKSDDDVEDIRQKLQANWQAVYNVIKNYTPDQAAMIEKATVDVNGRVVSLVISPNADQIKSIFNQAL